MGSAQLLLCLVLATGLITGNPDESSKTAVMLDETKQPELNLPWEEGSQNPETKVLEGANSIKTTTSDASMKPQSKGKGIKKLEDDLYDLIMAYLLRERINQTSANLGEGERGLDTDVTGDQLQPELSMEGSNRLKSDVFNLIMTYLLRGITTNSTTFPEKPEKPKDNWQSPINPDTDMLDHIRRLEEKWSSATKKEVVDDTIEGGHIFEFENVSYIFFVNEKVTWHRAQELCPIMAPGSHLAVVDNWILAKFVAFALCKHANILEDMGLLWVGGFYDGISWHWDETMESVLSQKGPDGLPILNDEKIPSRKRCFALHKVSDSIASCGIRFREPDCTARYGFLCQKSGQL